MIVLSSSKDVLSQNLCITKIKEVTTVKSPQIYFKAMVRRGGELSPPLIVEIL